MSESKVIHEFEKSAGELVRCSVTKFKGYPLVDIRIYFEDTSGEYRPTKRGVCVHTELIDELHKGISKLKEVLRGEG